MLRTMTSDDYDEVYALWRSIDGFAIDPINDAKEKVALFLRKNPGLSIVYESEGRIVGSVLAGNDGRRARLYHVCVAADKRMLGIGKAMVDFCLEALSREGVSKVSLIAFTKNTAGNAFWRRLGWRFREDLNYYDFEIS